MSLTNGTRLGPYKILSPLGAGGMGEVYLANDSKLDRNVAIKVLPETMTRDPERVARFEREAKLLASLNHPNIAAIHGFDDSDGTRFLVMEYVEGETLGSHLKNGPVAVEDALDIAKQISEALEAAHEQGVIHRDLKPANVMIREDGTVKVLDFGLAKARADEPSGPASANSPTITANFTRPGVVLGTAGYMSPEQARGRALDKRTDIWSFGILLFECLTGHRLFQGETANDSMGAIMHKDPEWSLLPPNTPPTIQLLLRRCLTKDRKGRLHDIADARIELENAIVDPTSTSLGLAAVALDLQRGRIPWRWVIGAALVVAAIGAASNWLLTPILVRRVARLTMSIPPQYKLSRWPYPTLSPDGQYAVFKANTMLSDEIGMIVRTIDQPEFHSLTGTGISLVSKPFFSPNGEWLAFAQDDKLKKVSMRGGSPITLCDAPLMRGGTWTAEGAIIFAPQNSGGLMSIPASGGTPKPFTATSGANPFESHRLPFALPEGRGVLFTKARDAAAWDIANVMVVSGAGGVPTELIKAASNGQYVSPGYIVFLRESTLMAARFDLDRLELTSEAIPVVEGVAGSASWPSEFSIDNHGTLMYMADNARADRQMVMIDHSGKEEPLGARTGEFDDASLSPDGHLVVIEIGDGPESRIGVLERSRDLLRVLSSAVGDSHPVWSPDGKWIVFASRRHGGVTNLYRISSDFSGEVKRLTESKQVQLPTSFAPDGQSLLYMEIAPETEGDIFQIQFDEEGAVDGEPVTVLDGPGWQWRAHYSPDGKWIGYVSYESGRTEILVHPSDGSGSAVQISTAGGIYLQWSPTENLIYYVSADPNNLTMMSVKYTVDENVLAPSAPEELFSLPDANRYDDYFDLTKDEKHFLFVSDVGTAATAARREPIIVLNWTTELEALVPHK